MAYTAHKDPEQVKEFFDEEEIFTQKVDQLVDWIKQAKHFIVFTGAGISTSAGIPDFRGPQGVWTLAAQNKQRTGPTTSTTKAMPTSSHMSLVELEKLGILKFLISQNCDGLHRRSGFSQDKIAELHGNSNIEVCSKCGKEYLRDFKAIAPYTHSVHDHRTGRYCDLCSGDLVDTIINFGEDLPQDALQAGYDNAEQADLCLVLGSSLTVSPACNMPENVGKKSNGKLVICNLQKTPLDGCAALKIYSKCDDLMKAVMNRLAINIPPFILKRRLRITRTNDEFLIQGVDFDGTPASIFSAINVGDTVLSKEPFKIPAVKDAPTEAELNFFGHYNEPPIKFNINPTQTESYFDLSYNPLTGQWGVEEKGPQPPFFQVRRRQLNSFQKIPKKIGQTKPPVAITGGGFSVNPKTDCPHFSSYVRLGIVEKVGPAFAANSCITCNDKSENWMCLMCGNTYCSRYVSGHAKEHFKTSGHCVAISFSDLSIWCYSCKDYIIHDNLKSIVQTLSLTKFG